MKTKNGLPDFFTENSFRNNEEHPAIVRQPPLYSGQVSYIRSAMYCKLFITERYTLYQIKANKIRFNLVPSLPLQLIPNFYSTAGLYK